MEGDCWGNHNSVPATDRTSIAKHIQNIYQTDELEKEPTCAKIAQVRQEGKRKVKRSIVYYNLDMIISVGYKVNSIRGTKFRQWANKVLKEYLLRGYVVYVFGASLKDAGKKLFAYIRMQETSALELLNNLR